MGYSVEKSTSTAWATLGWALLYNLGMLVVVAASWSVGHNWPAWHRMLAPRNAVGERKTFVKPLRVTASIQQVLSCTEEELARVCGTDSAVYARFHIFCVQLFSVLVVVVFPVLMGFYQQGANPDGTTGINHLSLSNVSNQSTVMWVSMGMLFLLTLAVCFLIWRHTEHVLRLRRAFFCSARRAQEPYRYAVIVTCIPPPQQGPSHHTSALLAEPGLGNTCKDAGEREEAEDQGQQQQEQPGEAKADSTRQTQVREGAADKGEAEETEAGPAFNQGPPGSAGSWLLHGQRSSGASKSKSQSKSKARALSPGGGSALPSGERLRRSRYPGDGESYPPAMTPGDIWAAFKELAMALYLALPSSEGVPLMGRGRAEEPWETLSHASNAADSGTESTAQAEASAHDKGGCGDNGTSEEQSWACSNPAQPYALPGEPKIPPYISNLFLNLFGDDLLHLQPVYKESLVAGAHKRWRHAVRMLNESRQRWEGARLREEQQQQEQQQLEGSDPAKEDSTQGNAQVVGQASKGRGPPHSAWPRHKINKRWFFFGGEEVESIPYWIEQVKEAAVKLEAAQAKALKDPLRTAVIPIFKSRKAAMVCKDAMRWQWADRWRAREADPPNEMWWANLRFTTLGSAFRTFWAVVMTLLMIVFFYIPVTLIASLASGKALGTTIGLQKDEVQGTWLPPFLQGLVPSLALHSVLWIFSPVFMLIGRWEGRISLSDSMLASSSRFYYVVVINVLIAYSLTSSLLTQIVSVASGKISVRSVLSESLPANAAFYIQYTLNSSLMCGMELGRLPIHICGYIVKVLFIGKAFCDRERHWDQGAMAYHVFIGYQNLIITFGIVYCIIAPLILPFSLLFCCIALFTWKHELMYIYKDPVDKGGVYWPHLMHHVLNALLISQITTAGMFSVKKAYAQAAYCGIPIVLTFMYYIWFYWTLDPMFRSQPIEVVAEENQREDPLLEDPEGLARTYFPSWMQPPVLPNLDLLAPSDHDIWHLMHPTRHLAVTKDYYPTPPATVNGRLDAEENRPTPGDPAEEAFWQLMEVIPRKGKKEV